MTDMHFYFALVVSLVGILLSFVILILLLQLFRSLEGRIDRLEDRVHNDYEVMMSKILELDTHFTHVESRLELKAA